MCCVMGYTGHDLSAAKFKEYLLRTVMRGPDDQRVVEGPFGLMGFGRLAIMGLTPEGMQPFYRGADCVVCNGELYGFRFEKEILKRRGYKFASDCDCEILLPLYYEYGLDMFRHMDSEFALILYDSRKDRLIAARDPIGIRPLFYGYSKSSHQIAFASEMQNLIGWCDDIRPFPIGSYYCDGRFVRYEDIADVPAPMEDDMETTLRNIREKLIAGVEKRLDADAPVGFLLSGGLDSSLVCSIAAKKLGKPIRTFAIGMDTDAIDLKYARQTAEYLGSEHHEIIINRDIVIQNLEEVIRLLGTWDITTIRASMGMYLLCMTESLRLGAGDIMVFLCAIAFAIQIMTVDHYAARIDGAVVSCIQFTVCGVVCCIGALIWGQPTFGQIQEGLGALLYAGVLSCGVGYTLQIVGQKGLNPTVAALIMSLESVIATISGWIAYKIGFLSTDQTLTPRQIAGCVIVFAAVILVQLPPAWFYFGKKNA